MNPEIEKGTQPIIEKAPVGGNALDLPVGKLKAYGSTIIAYYPKKKRSLLVDNNAPDMITQRSIDMWNGDPFIVASVGDQVVGIKPGDRIILKVSTTWRPFLNNTTPETYAYVIGPASDVAAVYHKEALN
jgi:hypothetical protein